MDPAAVAQRTPDRVALVLHPSGEQVTYRQLEERSRRLAHLLRAHGARRGGCVALVLGADVHVAEAVWAGLRSGLYVAPLDCHLTPRELAPQLLDAAPALVVTNARLLPLVRAGLALADLRPVVLCAGARGGSGVLDLDDELDAADDGPLPPHGTGARLLFSSGTTGRPRPFRQELSDREPADAPLRLVGLLDALGVGGEDVLLSAGPPHHAAPFAFTHALQQRGATVVQLERFDADQALRSIALHGVTVSQWVPTMLHRVLALEPAVRCGVDLSRHRVAVHSGAPCPVELKRRLLVEWGPIVHEYYGASEGFGHTYVSPQEWLERPGTVGRALSERLHVTGDDGGELPAGEVGTVWFERPGTTPASCPDLRAEPPSARVHPAGWRTTGDLGRLDEQGYLWLTGRVGHTVVTGGVNVYPVEVEDVLREHPAVLDAAVVGHPDEEYGQRVRALVQLAQHEVLGEALRADLLAHCRSRLAPAKLPRLIDAVAALPRTSSGKLRRDGLAGTPVLTSRSVPAALAGPAVPAAAGVAT